MVASSGEEALEQIKEIQPDLILMDIKLSGKMSGIEAAEAINARYTIPIVYMTANADPVTVEKAKKTAPYGLVNKPVENDVLQAVIEMALYKSALEKQQKEQNAWLEATLFSIGDAVIATDTNGQIQSMNPIASQLTGWPSEEARGKPLQTIFQIVNSKSGEKCENPVHLVQKSGKIVDLANHTLLIARDGKEYQIADSASPIWDAAGQMIGVVLVFRDVTREYQMREQLTESEARFRAIFEQAAVGVAQIVSQSGQFICINQRFADIVGYTPEEMQALTFQEITHLDDLDTDLSQMKRLLAGEIREFSLEKRYYHKNGAIIWVNLTVSPMWEEGEEPGCHIAVVEDITKRKLAEQNLLTNEVIMSETERIAKLGGWEWDVKTGKNLWTDQVYEIYGVDHNFDTSDLGKIISFFDPQYQNPIRQAFEACIEKQKPYDLEVRFINAKGQALWCRALGEPVVENGTVVKARGYFLDITAKKNIEESLHESEERFKAMYENTTIGLYRTTPEGQILMANPALVRMLGYQSYEELAQRDLSADGFEPRYPRKDFSERLEAEEKVTGLETAWLTRNGQEIFIRESARAIRDDRGKVLYYEGTVEDITERKMAEEQVKRDLKEKEVMLKEIHHRVKNNMNIIASLLSLQGQNIHTKEDVLDALNQSRNRIYSMVMVHEQLYKSDDLSKIDMKHYVELISRRLKQACAPGKAIEIIPDIEPIFLNINTAIPCGLILNELITNALKHAFRDLDEGKIFITFRSITDSVCELRVYDNGIGLPENMEIDSTDTLGLKLIHLLTEQIHGKLEVQRGTGTAFQIQFPPQQQ